MFGYVAILMENAFNAELRFVLIMSYHICNLGRKSKLFLSFSTRIHFKDLSEHIGKTAENIH